MTQKPKFNMSRRDFITATGVFALSSLAVGCSDSDSGGSGSASGGKGGAGEGTKIPAYVPPREIKGQIDGKAMGIPYYLGTPPEEYQSVTEKPFNGGEISSHQILWGSPGVEREQNQLWLELEKRLGVDKFDISMVPSQSYSQKLATTLASGNLPDFIYLGNGDANGMRAMSDGAFASLSEFLEGDNIKEYPNLATTPEDAWKDSMWKGEIFSVPQPARRINDFPMARTDALAEIGLEDVPDNGEDFKNMMIEFAKIGHLADREVWAWGKLRFNVFEPIFDLGQDFQVVDGKVMSKYELEQYPDHLQYVRDMWDAGVFHPDSIGQISPELFKQGQILVEQASFAGMYWLPNLGRVNQMIRSVPDANVRHFAFPSINGGPGVAPLLPAYNDRVVIPADRAKDKDRMRRLLKVLNFYRSPMGSEEYMFVRFGIEGHNWNRDADGELAQPENPPNESGVTFIGLQGNPTMLMPKLNEGNLENVIDTLDKIASHAMKPELQVLPNDALVKSARKLESVAMDFYNGIVSGRKDVSEVEEMRKQYLAAGGQAVKDEYQKLLDNK